MLINLAKQLLYHSAIIAYYIKIQLITILHQKVDHPYPMDCFI